MFDVLFPDLKTAVFVLLTLAIAIAALFGYADWSPTPEQSAWLDAIVEFIKALATLLGGLYVGQRVAKRN